MAYLKPRGCGCPPGHGGDPETASPPPCPTTGRAGDDIWPRPKKWKREFLFPRLWPIPRVIAARCGSLQLGVRSVSAACHPAQGFCRPNVGQSLSERSGQTVQSGGPYPTSGGYPGKWTLFPAVRLSNLFLLVKEVVDFAAEAGIRHSVRGSAAGSLVVFLTLGGVDPVANDLLFERFLNDGRKDLPDVDLDFEFSAAGRGYPLSDGSGCRLVRPWCPLSKPSEPAARFVCARGLWAILWRR